MISRKALQQNLQDAGCSPSVIKLVTSTMSRDHERMKVLNAHRQSLLDRIHQSQKCLDCLDYLLYRLEKEKRVP